MRRLCLSAGVISGLGDVVAQQAIEARGPREHDWNRTFRFSTIGLIIVVYMSIYAMQHDVYFCDDLRDLF